MTAIFILSLVISVVLARVLTTIIDRYVEWK
jgi:hypothetical protein